MFYLHEYLHSRRPIATLIVLLEIMFLLGGLLPEDIPKIKIEAIDKIKISALKRMSKEQIKVWLLSVQHPILFSLSPALKGERQIHNRGRKAPTLAIIKIQQVQ